MQALAKFLREELARRQRRNGRYSKRAFAKALKIDASTLNQLMAGKRRCSWAKADGILQRLGLTPPKRFAVLGPSPVGDPAKIADALYMPWPSQSTRLMREWLTYAVMSCFELKDFRSDSKWFARRLDVPVDRIERVLRSMERIGLIDRTRKPWTHKHVALSAHGTPDRQALDFVLGAYIKKGAFYLATNGEDERSRFCGVTVAITKDRLPEALAKLHAFKREMGAYLGGGFEAVESDEVYRLNLELFPLTTRVP